jgi:hypothetical protein
MIYLKLQSSKIFVALYLLEVIQAAEQRNIN